MVNITTKRPQAQALTEINVQTKSYSTKGSNFKRNSMSVGLDSTGPIGSEKVLYRALLQHTPDGDHFQKGRSVEEKLVDLAMTFTVGDSTKITPRYELTDRDRTGGSGYADGVFEKNFSSGKVGRYGKPVNRSFYYGSPDDVGTNKSESLSLRVEHAFNEDWQLKFDARSTETESRALDLYISDSGGLQNNIGDSDIDRKWVYSAGDDEYALFDLSLQGKFSTAGLEHHLLLGANYRDLQVLFDRNFQNNADALGKNTINVLNPSQQSVGPVPISLTVRDGTPSNTEDTNIYLKDRITWKNITMVAGVSHVSQDSTQTRNGSKYTGDFSDTIWDLGAIYSLTDDINIFATYSRSFDPVSPRYIAQYGQGKTDYKPIEGNNYELGLKGLFFDGRLSSSVTVYELNRENATKFQRGPNGYTLLQLSGESFKSKGIEWDASFAVSDSWMSSISYAYTKAHDTIGEDKGVQANNTPKHSVALWNTVGMDGFIPGSRAGIGMRYESDRNDGKYSLASYFEADAGLYYDAGSWSGSLIVKNLFDLNRAEAGANWVTVQPNDPRSINLSVRYRL